MRSRGTLRIARCFPVRDGKILLLQRSNTSWCLDKWECPGGKRDAGELFTAALTRELFEETGLRTTSLLPDRYEYRGTSGHTKHINTRLIIVIGIVTVSDTNITLSDEHSNHQWVHCTELFLQRWVKVMTPETRAAVFHLRPHLTRLAQAQVRR